MYILRKGDEIVEVMEDRPERRDFLIGRGYELLSEIPDGRLLDITTHGDSAAGDRRQLVNEERPGGSKPLSKGVSVEEVDNATD